MSNIEVFTNEAIPGSNFIGMELDETYFNIAKERIEKHEVKID